MSGIEAVGIAAAAAQFVDVGWKIFRGLSKLTSDLHHAPEKIAQATKRVDQLVEISQIIKSEASNYSACSTYEVHPIQKVLEDCTVCANDLQLILDSIISTKQDSRLARSWKSIVGVKKEKEILGKCTVLEDYKVSLMMWIMRENLQKTSSLGITMASLVSAIDQSNQSSQNQLIQINNMVMTLKSNPLAPTFIPRQVEESQPVVLEVEQQLQQYSRTPGTVQALMGKCTCEKRVHFKSTYQLLFMDFFKSIPLQPCPVHGEHRSKHQKGVKISLNIPLLRKVVSLSVAHDLIGRESRLNIRLPKVINLVDVHTSPAFQLFNPENIIMSECGCKSTEYDLCTKYDFDWSPSCHHQIRYFHQLTYELKTQLEILFRSHRCSPTDVIEGGGTLLHAAAFWIRDFGLHNSTELATSLYDLILFMIRAGVNDAYVIDCIFYDNILRFTALDEIMQLDITKNLPIPIIYDFTLSRMMEDEGLEYTGSVYGETLCNPMDMQALIANFPFLPSYFDSMTAIELALLRHQKSQLETLLAKKTTIEEFESYIGIQAISYAKYWTPGLRLLLEAYSSIEDPSSAVARETEDKKITSFYWRPDALTYYLEQLVNDAIEEDSPELLESYLHYCCPVFPSAMSLAFSSSNRPNNQKIQDLLLTTLTSDRCTIWDLDRQSHSCHLSLAQTVRNKSFSLPKNSICSSEYHKSIYHILSKYCNTKFADKLFARGFESIDAIDTGGLTPCRIFSYKWNIAMVMWLAQKGVYPLHQDPGTGLCCLHFLVSSFDISNRWDRTTVQERLFLNSGFKIKELTPGSDPQDRCVCYCSPGGCTIAKFIDQSQTPHSSFPFFRQSNMKRWQRVLLIYRRLAVWLRIPSTFHDYCLSKIARKLIFDRLGMVHTCCQIDSTGARPRKSSEEVAEFRHEDEELAQQLDQWVRRYEEDKKEFRGSRWRFWTLWWKKRDQDFPMLPDEPSPLTLGRKIYGFEDPFRYCWDFIKSVHGF